MDFNNINDSINQFITYTFINEKILDDDSNILTIKNCVILSHNFLFSPSFLYICFSFF